MCNNCDCENYEKCSIVGNIPLGFCCPQCVYYNEEHTCLNSKMRTESSIQSKIKSIEALKEVLGKSSKVTEKELENFP